MDWNRINKIHFIGIKGVGMTMLAEYLHLKGKIISGSDVADIFMTDKVLKKINAQVNIGFKSENIPTDAELIIFSSAYTTSNPELASALESKIKTLSYAEALAEVFNQSYGIAVCGSHGKTTTSAWLGYVMDKCGLSPSAMVGATVPQWTSASIAGRSNYLVIEADEYQNKFLKLNPKIILLNNIDYDHPDFFANRDEYWDAFKNFVNKLSKNGILIANFDDHNIKAIAKASPAKVISYSLTGDTDSMLRIIDKQFDGNKQYFKVSLDNEDLGDFSISLPGDHNISNALAVIACCLELEVDLVTLRTYLTDFLGTTRRFELLGYHQGVPVIDDYAHHPTEIRATLEAAKQKYPQKRLVVIFHPHTYSRTEALINEFATSFEKADILMILDIYASAREQTGNINSNEIISLIKKKTPEKEIYYTPKFADAKNKIINVLKPDDVILLLGAGDVFRLGQELTKQYD